VSAIVESRRLIRQTESNRKSGVSMMDHPLRAEAAHDAVPVRAAALKQAS
jgi:hypothetical protein